MGEEIYIFLVLALLVVAIIITLFIDYRYPRCQVLDKDIDANKLPKTKYYPYGRHTVRLSEDANSEIYTVYKTKKGDYIICIGKDKYVKLLDRK